MKRRNFLHSSILLAGAGSLLPGMAKAGKKAEAFKDKRSFYELRTYTFKNKEQQNIVEHFFEVAAIPALNRKGIRPVGVFTELKPEGQTRLFVLIPFHSVEDYISINDSLLKDAQYLSDGAAYLNAPSTAPAYERIESSLLRSFAHMPEIVAPANAPRIFELRRYESSGELAGKKKIEMFNDAGEIEIFKRTGLTPVFFGETIIGAQRPNLTYMITFNDMAAHDQHWKSFGGDPEWKKISSMPEYADAKIVSHITSTFLVPAAFSQV